MPKCSISTCGVRKSPNQPNLSLHRFPKNQRLRHKWMELIGADNIKPHKALYICCLHFEDCSFNRTMDVVRLRDHAVPTKYLPSKSSQTRHMRKTYTTQTATSPAMTGLQSSRSFLKNPLPQSPASEKPSKSSRTVMRLAYDAQTAPWPTMTELETYQKDPLSLSPSSEEVSESTLVTLSYDQSEHTYSSTCAQSEPDFQQNNDPDEDLDEACQKVSKFTLVTLSYDQCEHTYSSSCAQSEPDFQQNNDPDEDLDEACQMRSKSNTPDSPRNTTMEEKSYPSFEGIDYDNYPKLDSRGFQLDPQTLKDPSKSNTPDSPRNSTMEEKSYPSFEGIDYDNYPKLDSRGFQLDPQTLKDKYRIEHLQWKCERQRRKIKLLSQRVRRQEKKIVYLQEVITDMKINNINTK